MSHYDEPEPDDLSDVALLLGFTFTAGILAFIGWCLL